MTPTSSGSPPTEAVADGLVTPNSSRRRRCATQESVPRRLGLRGGDGLRFRLPPGLGLSDTGGMRRLLGLPAALVVLARPPRPWRHRQSSAITDPTEPHKAGDDIVSRHP